MFRLKQYIVSIVALAFAVYSCTPSAKYLREKGMPDGYENNFVRVLIGIEDNPFRISSESGLKVKLKSGGKLLYEMKSGKLVFYPEHIKEIYIVESTGTPLCINGRGYRGTFELHNVMGKISIVNVINVEEYLYSVVPSEMPSSWEVEALKAQAIASRTYIYYYLLKQDTKSIFDADATTSFQVYKGITAEKKETTGAVDETRGVIMTYNYEPILAYFHSTSGGKTADDKYVWKGADLPYLQGVKCNYGKKSPHYEWELTLGIPKS